MSLLEAPRERWRTPLLVAAIVAPVVAAGIAVARALRAPEPTDPLDAVRDELLDRTGLDLHEIVRVGGDLAERDPSLEDASRLDAARLVAHRAGVAALRARVALWVRAKLDAGGPLAESPRFRWLLAVEQGRAVLAHEVALRIADLRRFEATRAARPEAFDEAKLEAAMREASEGVAALRALSALRHALAERPTSLPHEATEAWRAGVARASRSPGDDVPADNRAARFEALRREGEDLRALLEHYESVAAETAERLAGIEANYARVRDEASAKTDPVEAERARAEALVRLASVEAERAREQSVCDAHRACVRTVDEGLAALEAERPRSKANAWW